MATGAAAGRERYRWLLLLVAAAMLVAWLVTGGGQEPDPSGGSTATEPSSTSPTHQLTETNTPSSEPEGSLPTVLLADLPPEAARTLELIDAGGPFPEDRDGSRSRIARTCCRTSRWATTGSTQSPLPAWTAAAPVAS